MAGSSDPRRGQKAPCTAGLVWFRAGAWPGPPLQCRGRDTPPSRGGCAEGARRPGGSDLPPFSTGCCLLLGPSGSRERVQAWPPPRPARPRLFSRFSSSLIQNSSSVSPSSPGKCFAIARWKHRSRLSDILVYSTGTQGHSLQPPETAHLPANDRKPLGKHVAEPDTSRGHGFCVRGSRPCGQDTGSRTLTPNQHKFTSLQGSPADTRHNHGICPGKKRGHQGLVCDSTQSCPWGSTGCHQTAALRF